MNIVMIGATGLVGRQLWPLLAPGSELLVLGRRPSGAPREKIGMMEEWPALLAGERIDVAVSTLGTTQKAAGSWDKFVAVDRDAVLAFARLAKSAGARQMLTISSSGTDAYSRNRYLRLKGEVEQSLGQIGFERLDILRPGLLLGDRPGESRLLEKIGSLADPVTRLFLRGPLDRYAGISAGVVARAMAALVEQPRPGLFHHHNREISALASD